VPTNSVPSVIQLTTEAGVHALRSEITVCWTTRVKSAIVFSLTVDGSGLGGCRSSVGGGRLSAVFAGGNQSAGDAREITPYLWAAPE